MEADTEMWTSKAAPFLVVGTTAGLSLEVLGQTLHCVRTRTVLGRNDRNQTLTTLDNSISFLGLP